MLALTSLNGDSAWLVESEGQRILLDPWLSGAQTDLAPWFSTEELPAPACPVEQLGPIDAIVISHRFGDHCHPITLRGLSPDVPVYAPAPAIGTVCAIGHFRSVRPLHDARLGALRLCHLPAPGPHRPVHQGLVLEGADGAVVYAPHGYPAERALHLRGRVSVLLTTTVTYTLPWWLGGTINLGLDAARALVEALQPGATLRTHDAHKAAGGLVPRHARVTRPDDAAVEHTLGHAPRLAVGGHWTAG
jgi:L-ascorbate metabolism protein UlaG (beta-lactamase superfamily)